jgi:uncharacterized membrane protein YhaH (DUF805 family)
MQWFILAITKKYADFSTRSRRTEFWMFFLFNIIISIVLSIISGVVASIDPTGILALIASGAMLLVSLALLIPGLAVTVRRLHDTGRSGWWILIGLLPVIGFIVLLVFMVLDSEPGENKWGPNPKGVDAGAGAA